MSVENYIRAMPKVELNLQFEGSLIREPLLLMAEQNDVVSDMKHVREFNKWVEQLDKPDYSQLDEIMRETARWMRYPDDLTRMVYEVGLKLAKQNVKYAEVSVIPAIYTDQGMTFETFLEALNDGRDRVLRGWGVRMDWILSIPRERPRKGDDISRWATSVTAKKGNVAALATTGRDAQNTIGQFKKAYATAKKRSLPTVAQAGGYEESVRIAEVVEELEPDRLLDTRDITDEEIALILELGLSLVVTPTRDVRMGLAPSWGTYPVKTLLENDVPVIVSASTAELLQTSITDEYLAAHKDGGLSVEQIEAMTLNAIMHSFLPDEDKTLLFAEFTEQFGELHEAHLSEAQDA